jgi:hypothetical protein
MLATEGIMSSGGESMPWAKESLIGDSMSMYGNGAPSDDPVWGVFGGAVSESRRSSYSFHTSSPIVGDG